MNASLVSRAVKRSMLGDFMVLVTIIIVVYSGSIGWYVFNSFNQVTEREHLLSLSSLAKAKSKTINQYIDANLTRVEILATLQSTQQALAEIQVEFLRGGVNSDAYRALALKYRGFFDRYLAGSNYDNLFLIDPSGNIVYTKKRERDIGANLKTGPYRNTGLGKVFRQSIEMLQTNNSTFEYYEPSGEASAFVATPIVTEAKTIGVVALQFRADKFYSVFNNLVGLGETGEIVVGQNVDNRVVLTAPLRHDPDAAFKRTIQLDDANALPIIESSLGKTGSGIFIDWRGEEVLAAWQYIPALKWGLVVKIDAQEAFGYWQGLRQNILGYIGVSLTLCYLLLFFFIQRITQPLSKLTEASASFEPGKETVPIDSLLRLKNEVGALARAFNDMLSRVQRSKVELEETVKQLRNSNRKLDRELVKGGKNLAELKNRELELKESNQELEQFAYIASHDLQEPLRKIRAFGDMLKQEVDLEDNAQSYLDRMLSASTRMGQLIDDLLTFSRVTTKGGALVNVDLQGIIQDTLDTLEIRIRDTDAEITIDPLPVVDADPMQMRQLFQNLIGNALKFIRDGVKPDIRIGLSQSNDDTGYHVIMIEDNGIGFKPEQSERIFEMFQRLHSRSVYKGTGVGLALCRRILGRHGGQITASAEEGVGARISIYLKKNLERRHG